VDKKNRQTKPDFDSLDDRLIAEEPSNPMLVIKTNLDPKDSTLNNPYYSEEANSNTNAFRRYFEGD
jgi:hypothetical protein